MTYAIVPAGGLGARMGSRRPKQYLRLGRVPILVATLRALGRARGLAGIVVAVPGTRVAATRRLLARWRVPKILDVVAGGADRQESVWRALQRIPENAGRVVVHDAVRPFINAPLVERVLAAAVGGAATCGLPVRETVKRVKDGAIEATVPRQGLWLTQTPQAFSRALLWEAHEKARRDGFVGTDDAMLVERLGMTVTMVPGLGQNLKITTREDLQTARAWAGPRRPA
ncbi:MAG: 2-C-methyl-D-erythritol 4-phosphate cytidylyltransferase [Candidatus Rokuibacteriota bacterium]